MKDQAAFWKVVNDSRELKFKWGEHDCVTFTMRCAIAASGRTDLEQRVREEFGEWDSARSAYRLYDGDLQAAVTRILGEPVAWARLSFGDVAMIVDDAGNHVVVVHDGTKLIGASAVGYKAVKVDRAICGWRV
jgi:hypothetical protein